MKHILYSAFHTAQSQVLEAVKKAQITSTFLPILLQPERVCQAQLVVRMDDGTIQTFSSFRSQHSRARGPYKGGIRFHENVSEDEVKALSMWMSLKTAVMNLPLGGGKGGVIINSKTHSPQELERISRAYIRAFFPILGPNLDVPAPDVHTNPKIMAWMSDEYSRLAGGWYPGIITGKPLALGGSVGRGRATAQGGYYVLMSILREYGETIEGKTIAIEGAGNAGCTIGEILEEAGAKVVAISDSRGGIVQESGIRMKEISAIKLRGGSVQEYEGRHCSSDELLELPVDILIPAALENRITTGNAHKIQAKYILELANGPTALEADEILEKAGVRVIPDILANAGGVTVSYFEQVQNAANWSWNEDEILHKLQEKMEDATKAVFNCAQKYNCQLRMGATIIGVKRILEALELRGIEY